MATALGTTQNTCILCLYVHKYIQE